MENMLEQAKKIFEATNKNKFEQEFLTPVANLLIKSFQEQGILGDIKNDYFNNVNNLNRANSNYYTIHKIEYGKDLNAIRNNLNSIINKNLQENINEELKNEVKYAVLLWN